ncbi:hypothetical protein AMTRI_Chr10g231400 [Amborella trichopoda]
MAHSSALTPFLGMTFILMSMFFTCTHVEAEYLSLDYYLKSCPKAISIIRSEMECAVREEPRMAASILRLHFHDCFVQGCDGSVLLDNTVTLHGEKSAEQNLNSLRGFEVVDKIKNKLESECPGIVSCADLLAIAARDAVILVGGPYWEVPVGRKDSRTASFVGASTDIPTANQGLLTLVSKFLVKGLSVTDMVALVGSHTIGVARCTNFRERIYGDFKLTSGMNGLLGAAYLNNLQSICPENGANGDKTSALDYTTPTLFDNSFFQILARGEGLLNSDQEMYSSLFGIETKKIIQRYAEDPIAFFKQFSDSMVKMGNITNPESQLSGEVRENCRFINA